MSDSKSPFHRGEKEIQSRLGVQDKIEEMGRRLIRDAIPESFSASSPGSRYLRSGVLMSAAGPGRPLSPESRGSSGRPIPNTSQSRRGPPTAIRSTKR